MLPHVFVDRSLGAVQVPRILRASGIALTTMREHYGEELAQLTADPDWIRLVAERIAASLWKPIHSRRNDLERASVAAYGSRLFCVPRADITAADLAQRFITNLAAIERAAREPGPFIYGVYPSDIQRLPL